jgi:hypothetical protein
MNEAPMSTDPTSVRFQRSAPPTYSTGEAVLSIVSLLAMASLSTLMLIQLIDPGGHRLSWLGHAMPLLRPPHARQALAAWTWLPFAFTALGSGGGALFELWLLFTGTPFEQTRTKGATLIRDLRLLNLAPVIGSIFLFVCYLTVRDAALRKALLLVVGGATFGLGFVLFFGGSPIVVPRILLGTQVLQAILVLAAGPLAGGVWVGGFLVVQAVLQAASLLVGTATPLRSTAFHLISTASGVLLYGAIVHADRAVPGLSHAIAPTLPRGSLARWELVAACLGGLVASTRLSRAAFNASRAAASNAVWSVVYFVLVSGKRFPMPLNLSRVYAKGGPPLTKLRLYHLQHPEYLSQTLAIPAPETLEDSVTALGIVESTQGLFALIARLDHEFPQANIEVLLNQKPRLPVNSNGSDYWPHLFTRKILGRTIPGRTMEPTPDPAILAYHAGQLLAYLSESGIAAPMLKPAPERGEGMLVLDLEFLAHYRTKADYEPYGGRVYLHVNRDGEAPALEVFSVVAPRESAELAPDPSNAAFRRAESMVIASLYFQVISGKHLAEIHMTHNLVEVALHAAFDAAGQWAHPFRTFMYLHLYSHELAEELTTEHLVTDGAVFSQIFATTHDSMITHLNDAYRAFEYGADEDFEGRVAMLLGPGRAGSLPPRSSIAWELRYAEIWTRYTKALVDAIYADDQAVQADGHLQAFYAKLVALVPRPLPARYDAFQTKAGVARYASDTIHHLVVRHQVYGTTGLRAALDPRISATQVPRDGGTPGVDEWRALACVALATARARFTPMLGDFKYLIDGVDPRFDAPMRAAFDRLQHDLRALEDEWTATSNDRLFNYDYMRALPSSLHTGPGY